MLQRWIKIGSLLALVCGAGLTASGCNTVAGTLQGAGQDISAITGAVSGGFRGAYAGAAYGAQPRYGYARSYRSARYYRRGGCDYSYYYGC
jgi:predicted small secreted protein